MALMLHRQRSWKRPERIKCLYQAIWANEGNDEEYEQNGGYGQDDAGDEEVKDGKQENRESKPSEVNPFDEEIMSSLPLYIPC